MKFNKITVGDVLIEVSTSDLYEVHCFTTDKFGQHATVYTKDGRNGLLTTTYLVFKYFIKVGSTQ